MLDKLRSAAEWYDGRKETCECILCQQVAPDLAMILRSAITDPYSSMWVAKILEQHQRENHDGIQ